MNWMDFMMRILLAVLLGFLIGLERQITGSDEVYRIASYIVSGVGFLCSGVIFNDSGTVRELNTAATP